MLFRIFAITSALNVITSALNVITSALNVITSALNVITSALNVATSLQIREFCNTFVRALGGIREGEKFLEGNLTYCMLVMHVNWSGHRRVEVCREGFFG